MMIDKPVSNEYHRSLEGMKKIPLDELRMGTSSLPLETRQKYRQLIEQVANAHPEFSKIDLKLENDSLEQVYAEVGLTPPKEMKVEQIQDADERRHLIMLLQILIGFLDLPYFRDNLGLDKEKIRRKLRDFFHRNMLEGIGGHRTREEFNVAFSHKLRGVMLQEAGGSLAYLPFLLEPYFDQYPDEPGMMKAKELFQQASKNFGAEASFQKFMYLSSTGQEVIRGRVRKAMPFTINAVAQMLDTLEEIHNRPKQ
jgi:hypothetical protein